MLTHPDQSLPRLVTGKTVFVFGSNAAGRHGAGAARVAHKNFGAAYGHGEGLMRHAYAIPTKDARLQTLPLEAITASVERFIAFVGEHPKRDFFLTRVGCGLAGYQDAQIAPLFRSLVGQPNVSFPVEWAQELRAS